MSRWPTQAAAAALALALATPGVAPAQPAVPAAPLEVSEVLASVDRTFPLLERTRRDLDVAAGQALEARGAFDLKIKAEGETLDGFYDNDRFKTSVEQPLAPLGLTLFGGYRASRGKFPSYDEKALASEGEFSAGVNLPLLRNRAVDQRRADVRIGDLGVDVAAQNVAKARLSFFKDALKQYWDWVAAGRQFGVARGLLDLAERRDVDLAEAVGLGQLAPVERTDNLRAILQRRSALVTAQRVTEATAIDLSLFYRAPDGTPLRPTMDRVPGTLPEPAPLSPDDELRAIDEALRRRPEIVGLRAKRAQQEVETRLAGNTLLPTLDLFSDISEDYGERALSAGVFFELPLQRRKAQGKTRQAQAKLAAIDLDLRYAMDSVRADVQDAASALRAAYASVDLVRQELKVARELEGLERDRFQLGDSTQFLVNLRELNTADAAFREVKALADYQKALVDFEAATGALLDRVPPP
jgi:outer membrane protein TolC